jgi:ABC-type glucose/galactose transport system permease subunit
MNRALNPLLYVWLTGVVIFGLIYNFQYIDAEGFIQWLLFGEVIASAKALVWPVIEGIKFFQ